MTAMMGTKQRVAALMLATMVAAAGAFAVSAATADDAHAVGNYTVDYTVVVW